MSTTMMNRNLIHAFASLALICPTTAWSQKEVMATINGSDAYTGSGYTPIKGDEVRITIKPGERFIAAPRYSDFAQRGDTSWRVYLKSGIECRIDRSRIRLLPEEPLMKLNYDASKKEWRKLRAKPVTQSDEAAWEAKQHGVNYYDTLLRASEGDLNAITVQSPEWAYGWWCRRGIRCYLVEAFSRRGR